MSASNSRAMKAIRATKRAEHKKAIAAKATPQVQGCYLPHGWQK